MARRIGESANTDVCLLFMSQKSLNRTESRTVLTDRDRRSSLGDALVCDGLNELANPQTTGVSSRRLSRKSVVCADHFVAV